jgi:hypothetical protein
MGQEAYTFINSVDIKIVCLKILSTNKTWPSIDVLKGRPKFGNC